MFFLNKQVLINKTKYVKYVAKYVAKVCWKSTSPRKSRKEWETRALSQLFKQLPLHFFCSYSTGYWFIHCLINVGRTALLGYYLLFKIIQNEKTNFKFTTDSRARGTQILCLNYILQRAKMQLYNFDTVYFTFVAGSKWMYLIQKICKHSDSRFFYSNNHNYYQKRQMTAQCHCWTVSEMCVFL